ncbi:MAG TPA: rRNA maturation RNase YbeY [Thermoanaerobaculia bacterium]|nr:rRNA maturation RNase YbeY [Thermoanaerobaculia bacterium]
MGKEPPARRADRVPRATPLVEVTSTVRAGPSVRRVAAWTHAVLAAAAPRRAATVSVLLCGDGRMRRLNREFRRIDRPTDVLSFPADGPGFLGDVAIDVPYAGRQARKRGHALDREVQLLLAHGVLHLLGHDHETDDGEMFRLQRRLVARAFGPGPDGVPGDEA